MAVLNDLSTEDQELIIRLPFRVGMWIGQSDQSGGDESAAREREALSTIVAAYAEDYLKSEFVQRVMEMTLARKHEWSEWGANIDAVPGECARAVQALMSRIAPRDVESLKQNLIDIGIAVAMAYCEDTGHTAAETGFLPELKRFFSILLGGFKTRTADANISAAEQRALMKLTDILGVKTNILAA